MPILKLLDLESLEAKLDHERERQRKQQELKRRQDLYEAQLVALRGQYERERDAIIRELEEDQTRESAAATQRIEMARLRHADLSVEENGARSSRKGTAKK